MSLLKAFRTRIHVVMQKAVGNAAAKFSLRPFGPRMFVWARCLNLCIFPIISWVGGCTIFGIVPQGKELLAAFNDSTLQKPFFSPFGSSSLLFTVVALVIWSMATYYSAVHVMSRRYPFEILDLIDSKYHRRATRDLPRFLGISSALIFSFLFEIAHDHTDKWSVGFLILAIYVGTKPWKLWLLARYQLWILVWLAWLQILNILNHMYAETMFLIVLQSALVISILICPFVFFRTPSRTLRNRYVQFFMTRLWIPIAVFGLINRIGPDENKHWVITLIFLAAGGSVVFLIRKKKLENFLETRKPVSMFRDNISVKTLIEIMVLSLAPALLISIIVAPEKIGPAIGASAVTLIALAFWSVLGTILLVALPKSRGWPNMALAPLLMAGVASINNDNHGLRHTDFTVADQRRIVSEQYNTWKAARSVDREDMPIFVVSAAGGGLRAAYWTAAILSEIDDRFCGALRANTFAISGVSGGALGAMAFVAGAASVRPPDHKECNSAGFSRERPLSEKVRKFLNWDYLTPTVAALLTADTAQAFFGPGVLPDRARAFERTIEKHWLEIFDNNVFGEPLLKLYDGGQRKDLPSILLNATTVDDGRITTASNLHFTPSDGYDYFDPSLATLDTAVSTTVHNSARFTYVSPAATVHYLDERGMPSERVWTRLVDGGYFDNSGASPLREIVEAMVATDSNNNNIYLIVINNSDSFPYFCDTPAPGCKTAARLTAQKASSVPFLSELTAPVTTVLAARESRATLATWQLIVSVGGDIDKRKVIEVNLVNKQNSLPGEWGETNTVFYGGLPLGRDIALGWFNSDLAVARMDEGAAYVAHYFPFVYDTKCPIPRPGRAHDGSFKLFTWAHDEWTSTCDDTAYLSLRPGSPRGRFQ